MTRLSRIGVALVAAFVALDVVLVTLAVRHVSGASADLTDVVSTPWPTHSARTPTPAPTRSRTPGAHRTAQPSDLDIAPATLARARTLIDIGNGRAVARATTGRCGKGGGKVELSFDGGDSFRTADVPAAAVVLRVASTDADKAYVVATDANCREIATLSTTNGGGVWDRTDGSAGSWHRLPEPGARLHAPAGSVDVPCAHDKVVAGFSTLSSRQAYALCTNGVVVSTTDGGTSWSTRGTVRGAADLDFVDADNGLAVGTGRPSCAGIDVVATMDGGKTWKSRACVRTSEQGLPDVSADGERAYLAQGGSVWFSDDGGTSWQRRSS